MTCHLCTQPILPGQEIHPLAEPIHVSCARIRSLMGEVERLRAERRDLREHLKEIEFCVSTWAEYGPDGSVCPACGADAPSEFQNTKPHDPNCWLGAALR